MTAPLADTSRMTFSGAAVQPCIRAALRRDIQCSARARHAELISRQYDDVRRVVLGDAAAMERLQAVEAEIQALSAG
jgi:hypothetical protein